MKTWNRAARRWRRFGPRRCRFPFFLSEKEAGERLAAYGARLFADPSTHGTVPFANGWKHGRLIAYTGWVEP